MVFLYISHNFTTLISPLSSLISLPLTTPPSYSTTLPLPPLPLSDHVPVTGRLSSGNGAAGIDGEVSGGTEGKRQEGRKILHDMLYVNICIIIIISTKCTCIKKGQFIVMVN